METGSNNAILSYCDNLTIKGGYRTSRAHIGDNGSSDKNGRDIAHVLHIDDALKAVDLPPKGIASYGYIKKAK